MFPRYAQNLRDFYKSRHVGFQAGQLERVFELEELVHCVMCLARGLEHVHAHGITHTYVKPNNVLANGTGLARVASEDFVKSLRELPLQLVIADFGMAQLSDPEHRVLPSLVDMRTQSMKLCTLPYRAPELLLGDRLFGSQVGIWSLG